MILRAGVALGLLGVLLFGGAASALHFHMTSQNDAIEQALDRLGTYEVAIATQPQLEEALERMRQQSASFAGLVLGTSASLAAANIQSDVRTITSRVGGEVRSTQNLPTSSVEGFEKLEIACDVSLPMDRLRDLLYQIEAHTPYLFLDRITMEVPQSASPRTESMQRRVEIHFIVRGYRWVGA